MADLNAICAAVIGQISGVAGIRSFLTTPPENPPPGQVVAFCVPGQGAWNLDAVAYGLATHTLHLLIVKPRVNLRTDYAALSGLGNLVAAALLADVTLGGTVEQINRLPYQFGPVTLAEQEYVGWTFAPEVMVGAAIS